MCMVGGKEMNREETVKIMKQLGEECLKIDAIIASIKHVKHKNTVVAFFHQLKVDIFEDMEKVLNGTYITAQPDKKVTV